MNDEQLRSLLKLGKSKTVIIYCNLCDDYIGYVKTITIMNEKMIRIEYDTYGYDEAGLTFFVEYEDINILIKNMQEYMGSDIKDWRNLSLTSDYPQEPNLDFEIKTTHRLIRRDLLNNKIKLPQYGKISMKEGYWKKLLDEKSKEMQAN